MSDYHAEFEESQGASMLLHINPISEPLVEGDLEPLINALLTLAPASRFNLLTAVAAMHMRGVGGQLRIHIDSKGGVEVEFFGLTPASRQPN